MKEPVHLAGKDQSTCTRENVRRYVVLRTDRFTGY